MYVTNINGYQVGATVDFRLHHCGGCGFPFMVPADWFQKLMNNQGTYYCPNGCCRTFTGPTEAQKLKTQLENERQEHVQAEQRLSNKLAEVVRENNKNKKQLKRVHNGVCPCCNRSFTNLARHMKTKHPDHK